MNQSGEDFFAEGLFRTFVSTVRDYAMIMLDPAGNVMSWNQGARAIKGWEASEIVGRHFSNFYTPEARAIGHPERELSAAASSGSYSEEGWRVRADGTRFWALITITALVDDDGELLGFGKITRDLTERRQAEDQNANALRLLEVTSRTDFLTGLANRRSLDETMSREMANAERYSRPLSVAMVDLDFFKRYNDDQGHAAGDRFLKQAAIKWGLVLRAGDMLARYGGEEFTVVLPETTLAQAHAVLDRLRSVTPAPMTCSIGVAEWDGGESASQLIGRADQSLLTAKTAGRDRLVGLLGPAIAPTNRFRRDDAALEERGESSEESLVLGRSAEADPDVTGTA